MMRNKFVCAFFFGAIFIHGARAQLSEDEARLLGLEGTPLTPMGAIRSGNKDNSIPAWEGGILQPPPGYVPGGFYVDPFSQDKELFTINHGNYRQYEDKLTPGQKALFERYPDTFVMHVYPTRRSASYPKWVYEATMEAAKSVRICSNNERCLENTTDRGGIPFPIPKSGMEAMWSHASYFYAPHHITPSSAILTTPSGGYTINKTLETQIHYYWLPPELKNSLFDMSYYKKNGGAFYCFHQLTISPPRSAGQANGGCHYRQKTGADAYAYIPGQRRVRKAPEVGFYDQPGTGSDGLRTADSKWMWGLTGDDEWYEYTLHGRKELLVPYNSYKAADPKLTIDEIVKLGHINPEILRYELHRVWVLEGNLKADYRHLAPHRFAYFDEDSWSGLAAEMYDEQGQLWRVSESFNINFYDVPMVTYWGDAHYDLRSGRYATVNAWYNFEKSPPDFITVPPADIMTPQGLRKYGIK